MTESAAHRYLRLGLRLNRHVDGVVDAYFGPPELAAEVEAAPPLDDGWLRDQIVGLRTYAGVLAGASLPYADEVQGCYGVRPV